jgi:hypothetical protein
MHEAALQEFWRQINLTSYPSPDSDYSVEVEGIGRVDIRRVGGDVAMSCFFPDAPDRKEILPRILARTDYRRATFSEPVHPVMARDGRSGYLSTLRAEKVTTPALVSLFERMLGLLEKPTS